MAKASPPSAPPSASSELISRPNGVTGGEKTFYTRTDLLKLCRRAVVPAGFPSEFKAWFGETPPQTSPTVNKRDVHHSNGRYDHNDSRNNRTTRRAPSPSSINITSSNPTNNAPFTRERAPHHRDSNNNNNSNNSSTSDGPASSGRERGEREGRANFKNPFGNADMLMGNFRIGSRTGGGLGDREKRDDDEGGLKKLSDTYDRYSRKSPNSRNAGLPPTSSPRNGLASDRRTTPSASGGDRRKGIAGDDERKDRAGGGDKDGASEKREAFERERAERKAERSEDWRRGASTLPSRPGGPAPSASSSPAISTKVPGRPSWNPAPTANSASSPRPNIHRRGEIEDDAQEPAWMGEWSPAKPSKGSSGGKGGRGDQAGEGMGGGGDDGDGEDVIQKFKREMREREARRNGTQLESTKEGEADEEGEGKKKGGEMPTSFSIGSFSIPLSKTNQGSTSSASTPTTALPPGLLIASRPPLNSTTSQPTISSALLVSSPNPQFVPQQQSASHQLPSLALPSASGNGIVVSASTPTTPFSDPAILSSSSTGGHPPARNIGTAGGGDAVGGGRKGGSRFAKFFVEGGGKGKDGQVGAAAAMLAGGTGGGGEGGLAALLGGSAAGGGDGDAQMNKLLAMLTSSKPSASPDLNSLSSPSATPLPRHTPAPSSLPASHQFASSSQSHLSPLPPSLSTSQQTSPLVSPAISMPSVRRPAEPMPSPVAFPPMDPNHIPPHLRQPSPNNNNNNSNNNNNNLGPYPPPPHPSVPGRSGPSPSSGGGAFPADPRLLQQQQSLLLLQQQQTHLASLLSSQQQQHQSPHHPNQHPLHHHHHHHHQQNVPPPPRSGYSPQPPLSYGNGNAGGDPSARLQQILEAQHLHRGGGGPALLQPPHLQHHTQGLFPGGGGGGGGGVNGGVGGGGGGGAAALDRLRELSSLGGGGQAFPPGPGPPLPPHLMHQQQQYGLGGGGGYNAYLQQQQQQQQQFGAYTGRSGGR